MKLLLCLYTCDADRRFLDALERTDLLRDLARDPRYQVLRVYANPALPAAELRDGRLTLPCAEAYTSLSVKTYLMIDFCLRLEFDFLLKLDATIASYGEKPQRRTPAALAQLTPGAVAAALARPDFFDWDYNGLMEQRATETGFVAWLQAKDIECDYRRVFPGGEETPPYYLGKFYSLSRELCRYVAEHGRDVAEQHARHLAGSEDIMIGRLYDRYCRSRDRVRLTGS